MHLNPFRMERWQSTYEHRVRFNLSESGVHPMSLAELLALSGDESGALASLRELRLGYGQSNGSDELRSRIAALHPGAGPENVLVTVGGAEANFAAVWRLTDPGAGGGAAVMLPNYMQVPGLAESLGGRVFPFRLREEDRWSPDLHELEAALEAGARYVLVTNPNNPTGRVFREDVLEELIAAAGRHGAWILSDEVYRGAEADGDETPSVWGRYDRVLVTNSLSKAYGLPGLRIGWALGPAEIVEELWARTDYTTIAPATLSDHLAILALEPRNRTRILKRTRSIIRENRAALAAWLDGRPHLFSYHAPDAGAIAYVRYTTDIGSSDLAEMLRAEKDVLVVPGDHFGMDRYLRLGFGIPHEALMEALGRIEEAFQEVEVNR